jgi:Icc-related predicted phosphoesterase
MKIVCISDTHGQVIPFEDMPEGDVLIHAGDITNNGKIYWLQQQAEWFRHLVETKYSHLICIGGNHDFVLDGFRKEKAEEHLTRLFGDNRIHYLRDSSVTLRFAGTPPIKFYGTPWVNCGNWAFSEENNFHRRQIFNQIPGDTDVLISHGPPYSILDRSMVSGHGAGSCGDLELLGAVERVRPRLHVFGHIHESYGRADLFEGTTFVNAASTRIKNERDVKGYLTADSGYWLGNPPIVVNLTWEGL